MDALDTEEDEVNALRRRQCLVRCRWRCKRLRWVWWDEVCSRGSKIDIGESVELEVAAAVVDSGSGG